MILVVDPSINSAGVALFKDSDLVAATTIKVSRRGDIFARCLYIAEEIRNWCHRNTPIVSTIVVEWPKIYTRDKSEGDPKNIIPLAGVAGAVAGLIAVDGLLAPSDHDLECVSYLPGEWAGRVPKALTVKRAKTSPRALKIERRLTPSEMQVWAGVKYHDAVDAIGIGMYHVRRFERIRVFPGAQKAR